MKYLWPLLVFFGLNAQFDLPKGAVYYKIAIPTSGVYSLKLADLKKEDLKTLNKNTVQLFAGLSTALPDTLTDKPNLEEIPLKWHSDNEFWFFANGPEGLDLRPNPHAKENYVFLILNGTPSKSIGKAAVYSGTASNLVTVATMHELELRNNVYSGREWLGEYFSFSPVQTIRFDLENLDTSSAISMTSQTVSGSPKSSFFEVFYENQKIIKHGFGTVGTGRYDIKGIVNTQNTSFKALSPKVDLVYEYITSADVKNQSLGFLDFIKLESTRKVADFSAQTIAFSKNNIVDFSNTSNHVWGFSSEYCDELPKASVDISSYRNLVFFTKKNLKKPIIKRFLNQGIATEADYLIVCTSESYRAALRLAAFRTQKDSIKAAVVLTNQIYDRYSSGKPDPVAIRNYAIGLKKLKYFLLFGDASYDPKNNVGFEAGLSQATIPTFQSHASLDPIRSFCSDDFFGIKASTWPEAYNGDRNIEIAVGRLPTKNSTEAAQIVEKIIHYETSKQRFGPWRLRHQYIADDGDASEHLKNSEKLTKADVSGGIIEKTYIDAYFQDTAKTKTVPALTQYLLSDGLLAGFVNYTGHGGREALAQERIITFADVQAMSNTEQLPVFFTATCEFGRFDDPSAISSAELALLNPRGGTIALCTTTRPVYSSTNFEINKAWVGLMASNKFKRLGDLFVATKNSSQRDVYNRNFSLLGDPLLPLPMPEQNIEIEKNLNGTVPNIKNGMAEVFIYKAPKEAISFGLRNPQTRYLADPELIYRSLSPIINGQFALKPAVSLKNVSVLVYAVDADSTRDTYGWYNGDIDAVVSSLDQTPPTIKAVLVNGQSEVTISDNYAIGFSEKIKVTKDRLPLAPIQIKLISENSFKFLVPSNNFSVSATDANNNVSIQSFDFSVDTASVFIKAYPNPFVSFVNFDATVPKSEGSAILTIFDSFGHILFKNEKQTGLTLGEIKWQWYADHIPADGLLHYSLVFKGESGHIIKGGRLIFWK